MKNMLKKLGVIGIIVAILIPFTELPVVNAASDCKNYLQNYLFIDTATGEEITDKDVYGGSGHINYAVFPKAFAGGNVKITKISHTDVVTSEELSEFRTMFNIIMAKAGGSSSNNPTAPSYDDFEKGGVVFNDKLDNNYEKTTLLAHKSWASYDSAGSPIFDSRWDTALDTDCDGGKAPCFVQKLINDFGKSASVVVTPATFKSNSFSEVNTDLESFIQKYANGESDSSDIAFKITRKLSSKDIKDANYKLSKLEGEDGYKKQGYYWPFVLNVEYQVCGANQATETWDLEYDENTDDDVTNMPSKKSDLELNKETDIDSRKPNREGYTFKNWCTNKDGTGDCYDAGGKITSSTSQTIILYAQWGKAGSEPQKPTGIGSYVLGFMTVGLVAGGIYLVAKKKNLFKQI